MTVSAQKPQIALVSGPIFEAASPCVAGFRSYLGRGIDVINVKCAHIVKTACDAFAAQLCYKRQFARPVPRVLVYGCAVSIPVGAAAVISAKSLLLAIARGPAFLARACVSPSRGQIASLTAIFAVAVFDAVGVHGGCLAAMRASDFDRRRAFFSHGDSISQSVCWRYFDIACKRIEDAYKQPDMFIERPKPPKQEALL